MTDDQSQPPSDRFDPYGDLSDLTGEEPLPYLEDPRTPPATPPRSPLLTGLIIGLLLVALSVALFQLLRRDDGGSVAADTTVATTTDDGSGTTDGTGTSLTTSSTTTTTVAVSFQPYTPVGDPIPIGDLRLARDSIGPIDFGTPAAEAVGRLIASLGEPDEDTGPVTSTGAFGVCAGDTERIVRWGPLAAIVVVRDGEELFEGYRLDLSYGGISSPATELTTLSGLKAADKVSRLEEIYEGFDIDYVVAPDLGETFELRSINTGDLLLWGPVTSAESDGVVLGIYAPDVCGRF